MPGKSERQKAREAVAAYHEAALGELVTHVAAFIDDFRNGDLDAFEVDRALFQYARAAKELWKFCNMTEIELAAGLIREGSSVDWWERGAPRR